MFSNIGKFNKKTFLVWSLIFIILLIPSFLSAFAEDDGTLGRNIIWIIFAKMFYVLRFPTHTLLWSIIIKSGIKIYFLGLVLNCFFYGFLTERLISIYKNLRQNNMKTNK